LSGEVRKIKSKMKDNCKVENKKMLTMCFEEVPKDGRGQVRKRKKRSLLNLMI